MSNHRAPVVGPWEPRTDAYTEYFDRSPAKDELTVLQQWFDVTLPAVRQYRQSLQDGVALERRSLGQVEIRY